MRVRPRSPEQVRATDQGTTLRVWLLGAFRVAVGSRIIDDSAWRLRKARSLIKLLALATGQRLHREQMMEALWSGVDPASAGNSLYQILHFARHTLQPDLSPRALPAFLRLQDDVITLAPPGEVRVDVLDFEAAASAARRGKAPSAYRAALDLYAGDLLPDDVYDEWVSARREELQQLRQTLRLELAGCFEEHEEFGQALTILGEVIEADSLNEEAHARLMRLHALAGDRQKALRQYKRLQDVLERELGIKPDDTTQRLCEDIKTGRFPEIAVQVGQPEDPETAEAAYRRRLSRVRTPVATRVLQTRPGNLPAPLTSFVGRRREVADVKAGLSQARVVTLLGPGGSGKTRLALRVAAELAAEFPDGIWFVDLAPLTDPALVLRAVATVLGVKEQSRRPLTDTLVEVLKTQRTLLILDNCEHVTRACADLCIALLQACPELRVLTTTREALKVHGEMKWSVPPLALPEKPARPSLEDLSQYDAVQLFVERARLSRPAFRLTETNAAPTLEVCRRLDGLPLAIELTAARLNVLSLEEILNRLSASLRLLAVDERGVPDRHQTARSAIDWSYRLLTPPEQILFDRLSTFAGGFTMEAAEAVCAHEDVTVDAVLDLLSHLVDKSMVMVEEAKDGSVRYRLLEMLRGYGRDRLASRTDARENARRHASFFLALAQLAEPGLVGPDQVKWLDRLEAEHDNLRAALDWMEHHDLESALRVAAELSRFWRLRGYLAEGRARLSRILAQAAGSGETPGRAKALGAAGVLAHTQGDYAEAQARQEESLAAWRRLGHKPGVAAALNDLAAVTRRRGDLTHARVLHEEALALWRSLGNAVGIARNLNNLGVVADLQCDYPAATSLYREALAIWRSLGDQHEISTTLMNLGTSAHEQGDFVQARQCLEETIAIRRHIRDPRGLAEALGNLGNTLRDQGDEADARAAYEEALAVGRDAGGRSSVGDALSALGRLAFDRGDYSTAVRLFAEAIGIRHNQGEPLFIARSLENFALLAAVQQHHVRSLKLRGAAEAIRERIGVPLNPTERGRLEPYLEPARRALGRERSEAALAEGLSMTVDQSVAYAVAVSMSQRSN